ncbi:MAG: type II toxin-antitoxin system prevent-host-death family antitoxin [Myxococcota bacterium]|jgi:prevent-host-death family protein|nr:type II toxin-antitoxin system prevent-host-death family antitoxin [Myxococcota bacterium]
MKSVGIRELKQDASRIVREVADGGEEISVTVRGQVVALLVPARPVRTRRSKSAWTEIDRLARDIGRRWPKGRSAAGAVRESRR